MLDYTKAAIQKTVDDFKRIDHVRNFATQILYIAYLIYALFAGAGIWWANAALLAISTAYFVFFMIVTKEKKALKKTVARIFTRCKQLIKLVTLGIMVYGICATTKHVTAPSVVFSAFLIVGWLLQIVFEVVFRFFINRAQFILEGIEADYEQLVKPAKTVGNFFKKLTGKEVEPEKEKSKQRLWLDKKVAENKISKEEEKREKKRSKKQARLDRKNTRYFPVAPKGESADCEEPIAEEVFEELPALPANDELAISDEKKKR